MGDRRHGGLGSAAVWHRVAAVCCSAGALLAVAAGSPAHADIDDLIDTVLNAATAGVDHVGGALDGFVPADFDPAAFLPGDIAAPDDIATALAGAAESGTSTDPAGQLEQVLTGGDAQLADAVRHLDESWINTDPTGSDHGQADGPAESYGGGFVYGDSGDGGDHDGSGSAAASAGTSVTGHDASGQDNGSSGGTGGGHDEENSGGNSGMPKLSAPSIPKGGSGGGGNGGGNGNAKTNRSAAKGADNPIPADPYAP